MWVALNANVKRAKILWTIIETCLNPGSPQELKKSYLVQRNLAQTFHHGPMIWKVMQRKVWCDIANWRTEQLNNYTKYQRHALTTINLKKKKWDLFWRFVNMWLSNWSEMLVFGTNWNAWYSMVCEQICTWCHQMNQSLWQTFSTFALFLHHTSEFKQSCLVGNTAQQCRLGLFQDSDFAGYLEDSKSTSGGLLCILGSHSFVPISWMCKKQTSVSHTSTESEIISLDASIRMDGIPALNLWDLVTEVFHSSLDQVKKSTGRVQGNLSRDTPSKKPSHNQTKTPTQHDSLELSNVDYVSSNAKSSQFGAMLYIFEDNEAVIKMIIKGRSPTMRRVSRTHRVVLDWLFYRINLDPKIQIKCRHQAPTRRHTGKGQFHTCWVEQSSPFVSHQPFQLCLLLSEFQLHQLSWNDGEKDAIRDRRRERWTWPRMLRQVLRLCKVQVHWKVGGHSGHPDNKIGRVHGNL